MITVKFYDVGLDKISWTATTAEVGYNWLYKQVKQSGAIMSNDLAFKNEHGDGTIFSNYCIVGKFEIVTETVTNERGGNNE